MEVSSVLNLLLKAVVYSNIEFYLAALIRMMRMPKFCILLDDSPSHNNYRML